MNSEIIKKMEDGKDKELMKLLGDNAKPFMRKADGHAIKCTEAKKIEYKDHDGNEITLEVPEGSYIVVNGDSHYPKIQTAEDFEKKNKFVGEKMDKKKPNKKSEYPEIGMNSIKDDY